jgi:hypothetical protein
MSKVVEAFSAIVQQGAIEKSNLIGCTSEEIVLVEQHFACRLPQAYKDFLVIAGRGAGKLFRGTDLFYPRVLALQSEALELFAGLDLLELLPNSAKVFSMHQGYEVNYFEPTSDDPPVSQFVEGQTGVAVAWESFSNFISSSIQSHLDQWRDLN